MICYVIRKDNLYLCGVLTCPEPYWGNVWEATGTTSPDQADDWRNLHGGVVEALEET